MTICDPACGTGGFLLAAHDYLAKSPGLDKAQKRALKSGTFHGIELVDNRWLAEHLHMGTPVAVSTHVGRWKKAPLSEVEVFERKLKMLIVKT